jgi:hypothetical protein
MKSIRTLATAWIAAAALAVAAHAQTYVLQSPVIITGSILTQGPDNTVSLQGNRGTVIRTKSIARAPFSNRQILDTMIERKLIEGNALDWRLVYLTDETGAGGAYATKNVGTPVAVPADLLTLPVFGASLLRGTEVKTASGNTFVGQTELAVATATVKGVNVSGLATNGIRTLNITIGGVAYQIDSVRTSLSFQGGVKGNVSDMIVTGFLTIGEPVVTKLTELPTAQ